VRRALRSALLSRGVVVATATKPERRDAPSDKPAEGLRASFMYPGWIGSAVRTSNTVFLDDNSHDTVLWGDDQAQGRIDTMVDAYFSGKEVPWFDWLVSLFSDNALPYSLVETICEEELPDFQDMLLEYQEHLEDTEDEDDRPEDVSKVDAIPLSDLLERLEVCQFL
jgi:hypothetical protein